MTHEAVLKRWMKRKQLKQRCVEYLGGKCVDCEYDQCPGALEFHHRDPTTKCFKISTAISHLFAWERIVPELDKCRLQCSNCHQADHWNTFNDINLTLAEEL